VLGALEPPDAIVVGRVERDANAAGVDAVQRTGAVGVGLLLDLGVPERQGHGVAPLVELAGAASAAPARCRLVQVTPSAKG
jgi:hypothetical protein